MQLDRELLRSPRCARAVATASARFMLRAAADASANERDVSSSPVA